MVVLFYIMVFKAVKCLGRSPVDETSFVVAAVVAGRRFRLPIEHTVHVERLAVVEESGEHTVAHVGLTVWHAYLTYDHLLAVGGGDIAYIVGDIGDFFLPVAA